MSRFDPPLSDAAHSVTPGDARLAALELLDREPVTPIEKALHCFAREVLDLRSRYLARAHNIALSLDRPHAVVLPTMLLALLEATAPEGKV